MITFNKFMYDKRKEKGLTLKNAAKKIGVLKRTLRNVELGYCPLPKNKLLKAEEVYEAPLQDLYYDTFAYTMPLGEKIKKSNSKSRKFYKFTQSWWTRIIVLVLFLGSISGFSWACGISKRAYDNPRSFATQEYGVVYDNVKQYGAEGLFSYKFETDVTNGELLFETDKYNLLEYSFKAHYKNITDVHSGDKYGFVVNNHSHYSMIDSFLVAFEIYNYNVSTDNPVYYGHFTRTSKNNYEIIRIRDVNNVEISPSSTEYSFAKSFVDNYLLPTDDMITEGINDLLSKGTSTLKVDAYSFLKDAIKSSSQVASNRLPLKIYYTIMTSIILLFVVVFCFSGLLKKRKFEDKIDEALIDSIEEDNIVKTAYKPLPKDWKFYPPIKEKLEQIIGLLFLAIGGLGTVLTVLWLIGGFAQTPSEDVIRFINILNQFVPISALILLYNNLDIASKQNRVAISTIFFSILGVVFFAIEYFTIYAITKTDTTYLSTEIKEKIMSLVIPGNFFFGLAVFNLIALFLFTMPKSCKTRFKKFFWRSLVVLPIGYIVGGYFVWYSTEIFGIIISPYIKCIFSIKDLNIVIFALTVLFVKFFSTRHAYRKYGEENASLYVTGNRFTMINNILISAITVVFGLLYFLIPGFNVKNSDIIENILYIVVFIPLVLFCAHRKEKRKVLSDVIYNCSYAGIMALPIIISVIVALSLIFNVMF